MHVSHRSCSKTSIAQGEIAGSRNVEGGYAPYRAALAAAGGGAEGIAAALSELPGFMPDELRHNAVWFRLVARALDRFLADGPRAAVKAEII